MSISEADLRAAKETFRSRVLENYVIFAAVCIAMEANPADAQLTDFMAEPWRPQSPEGEQKLGLVLSNSRSAQAGELTVSFAVYQYLPIVNIVFDYATQTGEGRISDELKAVADEAAWKAAADWYMEAYRAFVTTVGSFGEFWITGHTGTFAASPTSTQICQTHPSAE